MNYSETDVEKIFNDYANYYNQSGSTIKDHISVLAEISSIGQALEHHTNDMERSLEKSFQTLHITLELISKGYTREEFIQLNLESILERLEDLANQSGNIIGPYLYNKITFEEIEDLNNQINNFIDNYVVNPDDLEIDLHIFAIERILSRIRHVATHMIALGMLNYKIIEEYYPSELPIYSELSEEEKTKLRINGNQVGAPLREDVPQDKVEKIVSDLLEKHERDERVVLSNDGKKMMFQIVHEDGRYKGKANVNQIFKYFEHAHPNLLVISDRQFKERIKKAVPEGMK
jgi:hypothetical protein